MTTSGGGRPSRIRRQTEPPRGKLLEPETHPRSGLSMTMLTREEDETLSMFRLSVGRFLDRHATPAHLEQWRKAGVVDAGFWRLAGEVGILSPSVPEEYGGGGDDFLVLFWGVGGKRRGGAGRGGGPRPHGRRHPPPPAFRGRGAQRDTASP